jgi:ABC-type multidrug transport system ATPase subunit/pSer/pThr/pTyr-binding forkhead associated (FHA) protein
MSTPQSFQGSCSITFLTGPLAGQTFQILKPITTIGRESGNDIVVKGDLRVSRHHARLLWQDGVWSIENLSQASIFTVKGESVQQAILQDGAVINLGGNTTFRFTIQKAAEWAGDESTRVPLSPAFPVQTAPLAASPAQSSTPSPIEAGAVSALTSPTALTPVAPLSASSLPPALLPPESSAPLAPSSSAAAPAEAPAAPASPASPNTRYDGAETEDRFTGLIPRQSQTLVAAPMMLGFPSLEVSSTSDGQHRTYFLDKHVFSIGRSASNDIVIADQTVSDLHMQIVREGGRFVLIHPHPSRTRTANGLLYQGRKIRGDESYHKVLSPGDVFRIGDSDGTLVTLSYREGSTEQAALPPMSPIRLSDPELTIGRKPDNTLVLAHPQVSAHHARLVREGGAYRIFDLHSTNHVYVNGQLVTNHLLTMGDEIRIGPYRLIYESTHLTQYDESNNIRIDALNLFKAAPNGTTLLNNISLSIQPRSFVALVGGSGAGKTTLLDALSGLRRAQRGSVLYNGQQYYHHLAAFSTQIGYVPQDDIVHRDLTVERALYYAARLRLPGDFTREQIWQRISEVLDEVELTERRSLLIKKLSGGQRKRVSIAMELLGNPGVFFLDEPTSGLDPGLDRKMMILLRKLADKGHTIVLVTHATNNIDVCDAVCFLAQGGRLAYYGPPAQAMTYFGKSDFAMIYTSLSGGEENPDGPEAAEARFKTSQEYQEYVAQPLKERARLDETEQSQTKRGKRPKPGRLFTQFWLLSQRNLELLKNDRGTLFLLLLQAPLIALFLMLLVRFEIGVGVFEPNNIVQCRPQVASATGPIGVPGSIGQAVNCDQIVTFLKTAPDGVQYAQTHGGVNQALQEFIVPGQGIDAQRVLFLSAIIAVLMGVLNSILVIVKEGPIYRRERTVNLGILPYVGSKMSILGLLALFQSACLLLIVNAFEPLHQGVFLPVFWEAYISIALTSLAATMVGLLVSALATSVDLAQSLIPFIFIPQIIFAGAEIPLKDGVTTALALLFPTRWTMVGLGSSIGLHSETLGGDVLFGNDPTYHGTLYSTYSQSDATQRILLAWMVLAAMILVFGAAIGLALRWKDNR